MIISDQICSLEQAKKLKKLGLIQFSYIHFNIIQHTTVMYGKKGTLKLAHAGTRPNDPHGWPHYWSAYTVSELGETLPEWVYSKKNSGGGERWVCMIVEQHKRLPKKIQSDFYEENKYVKDFYAETEAQVRAEMLIHLLRKKLVDIRKINKWLAR